MGRRLLSRQRGRCCWEISRLRGPTDCGFAANDQMAMGFITELKTAGIYVPDQVSVAGFDDIEYSSIFDPALTTMRQPKAEIGRLAALELLRQMNDVEVPERPSRIRLRCDLIIRNSTKALRSGATSQTPVSSATRKSRLLTRPHSRDLIISLADLAIWI